MGRLRSSWPVVVVGIALVAAIGWLLAAPAEREAPSDPSRPGPIRAEGDQVATSRDPVFSAPEPPVPGDDPASSSVPPDVASDDMSTAWAVVDIEEVRRAMPDNIYWQLSFPTKDPKVLAERQAERERWNVEYGKVLSGTATEDEIRAYYDQRARLSGDYIEFTSYLLDHYRDDLPERDVGLLELARRLHLARLEEIPRKVEEAFERKRQQDAAREAWLAGEAEFGGTTAPGPQ